MDIKHNSWIKLTREHGIATLLLALTSVLLRSFASWLEFTIAPAIHEIADKAEGRCFLRNQVRRKKAGR